MITLQQLNELFYYDHAGLLRWHSDDLSCGRGTYKRQHKAGDVAGKIHSSGYVKVGLYGQSYYAHWLVYFMLTGKAPEAVDHINGVKWDNRIENLRECTRAQNAWNTSVRKTNKSGIKGISWCKRSDNWRVTISANGTVYELGKYSNLDDAIEVITKARNELHGDFARHL